MLKKTMLLAATAGIVATLLGAAPASAAQANRITVGEGVSSCPVGYLCAWERPGYKGAGKGMLIDEKNWNDFGFGNRAASVYNHGEPGAFGDVILYPCPDYRECAGKESIRLRNGSWFFDLDRVSDGLRPESHRWVRSQG